METIRFAEYSLSRMMLGTVQFGMSYGIANRKGQPEYADVKRLLAAAADAGINCLDTAAAYGTSEEILGRALHELRLTQKMFIVSKLRPLTPEEHACPKAAEQAIRGSVEQSLSRLRIDSIPMMLFHRMTDFPFMENLKKLKEEGLIQHLGVSCDKWSDTALDIVASSSVEAVQAGANILDQRYLKMGLCRSAKSHGVAVFIRSVYLQGLLMMEEVPEALQIVVPVRKRLAELAESAGIGIAELALRYILSQEGVSCVLIGVDNLSQLQENIKLFDLGPLPGELLQAIENAVPVLPESVITPALWPKTSK
ncbi:MAG: hypothetical protein A2X49_03475 [Lentisphaerae bacterium GWF2_52_8]|nr:MAG: hypothetical protein A2X49_03475 [Lentisphaerae bacterium GWF2_52_8]